MRADPRPDVAVLIGGKIEFRADPGARPGDIVPALARLLRRLRDRQRAERGPDVSLAVVGEDDHV